MYKKNIFIKKKSITFFFKFLFLLIFLLIIFIIFINFYKYEYIKIEDSKNIFFTIPDNKEGMNLLNQDKKGLHLSYEDKIFNILKPDLNFSIQVATNSSYLFIENMKTKVLNKNESIFNPEDLHIVVFNNSFDKEYFLLYKNFISRDEALDNCKKHNIFFKNCIIVNVKNID